ncbi:MAG TPA: ATP-binding protein [Candidatus Acidoferrales bacterium]|nr:ATP-binding protein [Candidatus Acidoferrales bacterium]
MAATILTLAARWLLDPALGDHVPYSLLYAAVALSAIYLGLGPSVVSAVLGLLGTLAFFVEPRGSLAIAGVPDLAEALTYIGVCAVIIVAGETNRRSKSRLKCAHEQLAAREESLRLFSSDLEKRVIERTAELKRTEASARQLGAQVLKMQDDERRRIARELHDSVGQMVALLNMDLGRLRSSANFAPGQIDIVSDCKELAENVIREIRTISHLLHPPLLDEMGLPSALKWYIDEFSRRSGVLTYLELAEDFGRLPGDYEIALFRIVQESLTNVHRHSGSKSAAVRLIQVPGSVGVEISDHGKGIPAEKRRNFETGGAMGVGLRGMRERVEQLGGTIELRSGDSGTTVCAILPIAAADSPAVNLVSTEK